MENKFWSKLWIGLLLTIAPLVGNAQTTGLTHRVAVYIPFDFAVADKTLPSGLYELSTKPGGVLDVNSGDGRNHVFAQLAAWNGNGDDLGRVVFKCYGYRCFLSSVWAPGHDLGWELLEMPIGEKVVTGDAGLLRSISIYKTSRLNNSMSRFNQKRAELPTAIRSHRSPGALQPACASRANGNPDTAKSPYLFEATRESKLCRHSGIFFSVKASLVGS